MTSVDRPTAQSVTLPLGIVPTPPTVAPCVCPKFGLAHHWQIERPNGETSMGYCECGASQTFSNWRDVGFRSFGEYKR